MQNYIGFSSIILTIFIWGTWLIFSRRSAEKIANPFLENVFITSGALICNFSIFLIYSSFYAEDISFSIANFVPPFLSGILWALAGLFALIAIGKIGVGKAMSIWAPSGMLVSFLWGVLYYKEFSGNIIYALLAVALIIAGVIMVIQIRSEREKQGFVLSGALFALCSSLIWGGTYLIPIKELSAHTSPFITLFPLSLGMIFGALLIFLIKSKNKNISLSMIKTGYPIIISGFMWGIGNMFAVIAVLTIGMGKAYPMAELCGVVNALFAVFILKEMQDTKKIKYFLLATAVSFIGALWLSILKI